MTRRTVFLASILALHFAPWAARAQTEESGVTRTYTGTLQFADDVEDGIEFTDPTFKEKKVSITITVRLASLKETLVEIDNPCQEHRFECVNCECYLSLLSKLGTVSIVVDGQPGKQVALEQTTTFETKDKDHDYTCTLADFRPSGFWKTSAHDLKSGCVHTDVPFEKDLSLKFSLCPLSKASLDLGEARPEINEYRQLVDVLDYDPVWNESMTLRWELVDTRPVRAKPLWKSVGSDAGFRAYRISGITSLQPSN